MSSALEHEQRSDVAWRLSASELTKAIRRRELRARDVLESCVARIKSMDRTVRAVVALDLERARRRADEIDARDAPAESDSPLLGVPCLIKECIPVRGMPFTAGAFARRGVVADRDAVVVERLRASGAIVLGSTNLSELALFMECDNPVYGRTENPYAKGRTAGGSSGGSAAAVAYGAVPIAIGADLAGSIRLPAFFCGVFGHKPSADMVPNTGQFPPLVGTQHQQMCIGPLTRSAADLATVTAVLGNQRCTFADRLSLSRQRLQRMRVLDARIPGWRLDPEIADAQTRAVDRLRALGCSIERLVLPDLRACWDMWRALFAEGVPASHYGNLIGLSSPRAVARELLLRGSSSAEHTLPMTLIALAENSLRPTPRRRAVGQHAAKALQARWLRSLAGDAIMVAPPAYAAFPPKHGRTLWRTPLWLHAALINVLGFAASHVPMGLSCAGLPLGVQLIAPVGRDALCFATAAVLEAEFGGWVPPQ